MLPKTISDDHKSLKVLIKSTERHLLCAMVCLKLLIELITTPLFPLLRRPNGMSDCIKTFDAFDWQIKAVDNICSHEYRSLDSFSL